MTKPRGGILRLLAEGLGIAVLTLGLWGALDLTAPEMTPRTWRPVPTLAAWNETSPNRGGLSKPLRLECDGVGPEAFAANDRTGEIATGLSDGSIRLIPDIGKAGRTLAKTGGVPLGIGFLPDSTVVVADAKRGLLQVDRQGHVETLSTGSKDGPLRYADGLVVDAAGRYIYFTDVSARRGLGDDILELVEHHGTGRLLRFDTLSRQTTTLLSGFEFANGVTLGPNDQYVLVAEMGAYRIRQYWLAGPKKGTSRIFADGLPGFPDNITFNGRDTFWVGIRNPRLGYLDALAGYPNIRRSSFPLISWAINASDPGSRVVGLNLAGNPSADLQGHGPDAYSPVTEAHEIGSRLLIGSDLAKCLAVVPRPKLP